MEAWKEELYHHGIQGQKWGVRNGPPYPLDSSQMSGRERKIADKASKAVIKESGKKTVEDIEEYMDSPEYKDLFQMKYSELMSHDEVKRERHRRIGQRAARDALITIGALAVSYVVLDKGLKWAWGQE